MAKRPSTIARKKCIEILLVKQGNSCCYCGCEMDTETKVQGGKTPHNLMTLEHLQRIEEGGTNELDNLALACYSCNHYRGKIDWFTYKSYIMGELFT